GVLLIEATFDEVYRALLHKAIVILISQGATIFLVSFFILYITHRLVTRHLTALAGFLGQYDLRQPPLPLRLQRRAPKDKDELDQVIAAFESMRQNLERAYGDLRESEQRFRDFVYQVRRVDGTLGFVSISGKPVLDAAGRFSGYRGVARDITERQRTEEALRQAQAELAHVARLTTLGELTASIAHEINQPLGAMVNSANACVRWLTAQNRERAQQSALRVVAEGQRA